MALLQTWLLVVSTQHRTTSILDAFRDDDSHIDCCCILSQVREPIKDVAMMILCLKGKVMVVRGGFAQNRPLSLYWFSPSLLLFLLRASLAWFGGRLLGLTSPIRRCVSLRQAYHLAIPPLPPLYYRHPLLPMLSILNSW